MSSSIVLNRSLLSSQARIQAPWVKVTIGDYTFGIFDEQTRNWGKNTAGFYAPYSIQFPQYIKSLEVKKINGQVNTYTLHIEYPINPMDDPNFFEKVFSSVSNSRKIIFTYGDAETPAYIYKNEEALITSVNQEFNLVGSTINYTVQAVSAAALTTDNIFTHIPGSGKKTKPSDEIKKLFATNDSLKNTFTGMSKGSLENFIAGDDEAVTIEAKYNISVLDYIKYLVGCMVPAGTGNEISKEIYVLTIHDDLDTEGTGPYFKVSKISTILDKSDAYEIDIGINTSTIVRSFRIEKNENYSIYYNYQKLNHPEKYVRRINNDGIWEDVYAPTSLSRTTGFTTSASDATWWSRVTQFPINASIQIQGLLRPATLLQYVRLNVIFPGGNKHNSSGLYIVTSQIDVLNENGYATNLSLTRIKGDTDSI